MLQYKFSLDITVQPVGVLLSSMLNYTDDIDVIVKPDDIALEGTEEIELRFVPLPPWNETAGLLFRDLITLLIIDSDGTHSCWY